MLVKVADITGALLDYWTARAEGIPAKQLNIRQAPRTDNLICVRKWHTNDPIIGPDIVRLAFSTLWAQGGPLIDKHDVFFEASNFPRKGAVFAYRGWQDAGAGGGEYGPDRLTAACRAVVRAAFGDEVEEVAVCE